MSEENDEKSALVPRRRFPEFRESGEWEQKELSEFLFEYQQRNRDLKFGPQDVLSVSGEFGCVNQIAHLGRSYAGVSVKDYRVVETGDIVYTKSPLKRNPFGIIKENKGKVGIVSTLYAVYRAKVGAHPAYFDHYFSRDYFLNGYLQPLVKKGAKNDMKVNNSVVLSGDVIAPKKEEQQKIADCLSSLDELVAAESQKLGALKAHKKGLMQQLFPREGETVPRLRFLEFREAPDWETCTLGDVFETTSGGTPSRSDANYWDGGIPWITTSLMNLGVITEAEEFISEDGLSSSSAKLLPKGTVLIAMYGQGKTRGQVALLGIEAATNQACAALLPKDEIRPYFVFLNLSGRYESFRKLSNSGGQENLSQALIRDFPFSYPMDEEEQQRIVGCLSSLDDVITAQSQKIEALKIHKQGLMQQLFPILDEVLA